MSRPTLCCDRCRAGRPWCRGLVRAGDAYELPALGALLGRCGELAPEAPRPPRPVVAASAGLCSSCAGAGACYACGGRRVRAWVAGLEVSPRFGWTWAHDGERLALVQALAAARASLGPVAMAGARLLLGLALQGADPDVRAEGLAAWAAGERLAA